MPYTLLKNLIFLCFAFELLWDCSAQATSEDCNIDFATLGAKSSLVDRHFSNLQDTNPELYRLLKSPAQQMWKRDANNSWNKLLELLNNTIDSCQPDTSCSIELRGSNFYFHGYIKKLSHDFELSISAFAVLSKDKAILKYGKSPKGLQTALPSLFGVLISAVNHAVDKNPEFKTITITAARVINRKLALQLENMGFIHDKNYLPGLKIAKHSLKIPMSALVIFDPAIALKANTKIGKLKFPLSKAASEVKRSDHKSWMLRLNPQP